MISLKNNAYSYNMQDYLGKGAYGLVVRCRRNSDGQMFALKIIEKIKLNPREYLLEALQREIDTQKIATNSNLPFFVGLYDHFEDDKSIYMILELCESSLLEQIKGTIPELQALDYVFQVALGLAYLHKFGITHRDIKIENILVKSGYLKIADFGFAISSSQFTTSLGTKTYMSPEFFDMDCEKFTTKVDVWALNTCLYKLITGSFYFYSPLEKELKRMIVSKEFELDQSKFKISPSTANLLKLAYEKDPAKRLSMSEFCHHPAFTPLREKYAQYFNFIFGATKMSNITASTTSTLTESRLPPGNPVARMMLAFRNNCLCYSQLSHLIYSKGFNKFISFYLTKLQIQNLLLMIFFLRERQIPDLSGKYSIVIKPVDWDEFISSPLYRKICALYMKDVNNLTPVYSEYHKTLALLCEANPNLALPDADLNIDNRSETVEFLQTFATRVKEIDYVHLFQEELEVAIALAKKILDYELENPNRIFEITN